MTTKLSISLIKECFISDPDHLTNILAANTDITKIVLLFLFLLYTVWPQIKYTQIPWKHIIIMHVALYHTIWKSADKSKQQVGRLCRLIRTYCDSLSWSYSSLSGIKVKTWMLSIYGVMLKQHPPICKEGQCLCFVKELSFLLRLIYISEKKELYLISCWRNLKYFISEISIGVS